MRAHLDHALFEEVGNQREQAREGAAVEREGNRAAGRNELRALRGSAFRKRGDLRLVRECNDDTTAGGEEVDAQGDCLWLGDRIEGNVDGVACDSLDLLDNLLFGKSAVDDVSRAIGLDKIGVAQGGGGDDF